MFKISHVEAFSLETHLNTKVQDKPCSGILCGNAPGVRPVQVFSLETRFRRKVPDLSFAGSLLRNFTRTEMSHVH